ncbi:hypothetical protein [Candidatus Proelusimicrobium excrementi]|uniref:hypothetical protein n=1 Tax=Candidatus Proelusimicrobium excrementi TaxID=3416222 RepID=UPI003CC2CC28|nr:hypothetical protein [Elusimicrobiaceae bacterium]
MAEQDKVIIKIETQADLNAVKSTVKELKDLQVETKKIEKVNSEARDSFISMGAKLAAGWAIVTQGIGLVLSAGKKFIQFANEAIQAHLESARAVKTLEASYQALGITGTQAIKNAQAFASEMQAATGIADETFLNAQKLMAQYGIVGQKAQEAIKAAYALSQGVGMSFESAMMQLAKASVGATESLLPRQKPRKLITPQ